MIFTLWEFVIWEGRQITKSLNSNCNNFYEGGVQGFATKKAEL